MKEWTILSVVGARPNFMKVAPLHRSLVARGGFRSRIIHTGQHYDSAMSEVFFRQLDLPEPDVSVQFAAAHGKRTYAWSYPGPRPRPTAPPRSTHLSSPQASRA